MSIFDESDVAGFRANYLQAVQAIYFPQVTYTDDFVLGQMQAAEADIAARLKVFLEPTQVFPYQPTEEQIAALDGMPYYVEPGYDYDPDFFRNERWGYIVTRQKPIIAVQTIQFIYPTQTSQVYQIPNDWLRIDYKYGQIRMVPASSTFVAPLGAFLMQALGGGSSIPSMIQVLYTAGLSTSSPIWPALIDVIQKLALVKMMQNALPASSGSISADGLSDSLSVKIEDYENMIDRILMGPKGSNGGLWTAIHGVVNGMIGVV